MPAHSDAAIPTIEQVQSAVSYDPETGIFIWQHRADMPQKWNTKYAGVVAGTIDKKGYRQITISYRKIPAHRIAWFLSYGAMPYIIDHINNIQSDNRLCNLRIATREQNQFNQKLSKTNTSGFKGASWCNRDKIWYARIQYKKKVMHLGCFKTPENAHAAYRLAATRLFGEFANFG